jgi:hypothetical protein
VPYSLKPVIQFNTPLKGTLFSARLTGIKNKKMESLFKADNLSIPPDSERSETFEALIHLKGGQKRVPAFLPFTEVVKISDIALPRMIRLVMYTDS